MSSKLSNLLGYYYVVFQGIPGRYAKCWIDGEEEYTYLVKTELLESTQKDLPNLELLRQMAEAFDDTYLHLWDVENDVITKLKPTQNKEILRDRLSDIIKPKEKSLIESSSISWDYDLDNLFKIR